MIFLSYLFIVNVVFFRRLGLPGAWCSIDGTHVPLGKCPEDAKVMYKSGRYPKPTMAFIVLASHNYQILYCSQGYPGSQNDIQLVQQDKFMQELSIRRYSPVPFWSAKLKIMLLYSLMVIVFLMVVYLDILCIWTLLTTTFRGCKLFSVNG